MRGQPYNYIDLTLFISYPLHKWDVYLVTLKADRSSTRLNGRGVRTDFGKCTETEV